jgi:hypothetical protein
VPTDNGVTLAQRLNGKLYGVALLLALVYVVAGGFRPMLDNVDIGWHVAQGRWMVEHGAIYRHDVLNYPNFGRPAVDEYPFFQVVLYLFSKPGWWGPCLLTAASYAALIILLARAARVFQLEGSALFTLSVAALILYLQVAFPLRPHLVTYLSVTILAIFLLRHREARNWTEFWPVALLQIVWTNSHSGFVLGPALVALFGLEMTVRRAISDPAACGRTLRVWVPAFLLVLLACFVNPFGPERFQPVFYQEHLESIRAYVGEMQPLGGGAATLYGELTLIAAAAVVLTAIFRRGAISYSLLLVAILFYFESLSVKKAWPVFGLFIPLLILSSGAFAASDSRQKPAGRLSVIGNFVVAALFAMGAAVRLDGGFSGSLQAAWRDHDLGRTELSTKAAEWMKAHGIEGRLLHRCEDGGCLQQAGYDHGETFGDTGFGKYDAAFVHTLGLLSERPALLPSFIRTYHPDYVVCGTFCYAWPYYLRQNGWSPVFYSTNSSVWARPETRSDLTRVSDDEVKTTFDRDLTAYGRPSDSALYGRNLLMLQSMGLEDFAFSQLTSLPDEVHHAPWYWEAARILCFETPRFSPEHRHQLLNEAEHLPADALTAEFRAYAHEADGDTAGARQILTALSPAQLGSHAADLLLKLDLQENRPEALVLAERPGGFELRDGFHWELAAEAEAAAGHLPAALQAWKRAVFYNPDDPDLIRQATLFASQNHADDLQQEIESGPPP